MDRFIETSSENVFTRAGNSVMAMLLGIVMVPASILLLYWNEGRAVEAVRALDQGLSQLVEANSASADASLNGRLVHLTGMAETAQPARDDVFGVTAPNFLRVSRKVEMYQWKEHKSSTTETAVGGTKTTTTTYDYTKEWSESAINSTGFKRAGQHMNPEMTLHSAASDSPNVKIGAFRLDPGVLDLADNFQTLPASAPGSTVPGYREEGGFLYHGASAGAPEIGDVRVSFAGIPVQTFSIVAKDSAGTLVPYRDANGYTIALLRPGEVSGVQLFSERKQQEGRLTWILRGVGFVLMLGGFMLTLSIFATLASVLPFLSGLVEAGAFVVAISASVPITLLTIAFAWLAHRPLIAVPLIVAAIGFFVMMHLRHRPATVQKEQAT